MNDDLEIRMTPLADIRPYDKNPRKNIAAVPKVAESIRQFGFRQPIVVDKHGVIIAGHTRFLAAKSLGLDEAPVHWAVNLSSAQARAYRIADNRTHEEAEWDFDILAEELKALQTDGETDMVSLGFDQSELQKLLAGPGLTDPDDVPEEPARAVSVLGDLWLLGDHRLVCGDSTDAAVVADLFGAAKAAVVITDPPYGVNYGDIANSRSRAASVRSGGNGKNYDSHASKKIANDDLDGPQLQAFLESVLKACLPHLIDNPAFYLWHPMLTQGAFFAAAAAAADILIHRQIIWVKKSLILGRGDYHWRHELCFYGWIRGKRCGWYAGRDQTTVWEIGRENDGIHPTQKPVECMKRPIENNSVAGDAVYEPFSGSGTTIIAAEQTGRRCLAIELSPVYVDVAILRWQNFTGKLATLSDGRTFYEVNAERHG